MSAIVPRKFMPNQVRLGLINGQLVAQLIRLRSPWDQTGEVVGTAIASSTAQTSSQGVPGQGSPSASAAQRATTGTAHWQNASPIPPGQLHPTSKAQLDKLTPPFVLLSELEACRRAGASLCSALRNKGLQEVVGAEIPHPLAHDQRLQALLRSMESSGVRVARTVLKAKVLKHQ
mmetsp:Transcript_21453/g.59428  ORF Transcript_21453/g.59428 Transcript_21453/m.59428 type:complete len:175 (+) Transcript_21453:121-645(+)|eukprot:CAMPEP_0202381094 /NCGR_PEP_ID=MMETSP1127-20130417/33193_1 /ASSEMBLY_ACC=CAM_ASM_000462 /TAXON_ID=3047 /ORGANISM="Dunaliella tertiolecta, Strain CCMP1320" /LENGTH=174 /DNA_ID=CAMNT_0048979957 /DNA_START=86 /DNA_END=610 /DNA_ORIENTATION=-